MSLADLVRKAGQSRVPPLVSPIPDTVVSTVGTVVEGVPHLFTVDRQSLDIEPGWYIWHTAENEIERAEIVRNGFLIASYMLLVPQHRMIALWEVRPNTWLCVPWNRSDAHQRGLSPEPQLVYLVGDHLLPLDVVIVCRVSKWLVYGYPEPDWSYQELAGQVRHELETSPVNVRVSGATPDLVDAAWTIWLRRLQKAADSPAEARQVVADTLEAEAAQRLRDVGAELESLDQQVDGSYAVWFYRNGRRHRVDIDENFRVESFGFCVSYTEGAHTLDTAVHVIDTAMVSQHHLDRPDYHPDAEYVDDLPF